MRLACSCCGRAFVQRDRVLLAIADGAMDVRAIARAARVPSRHVGPLVGRLRKLGLVRGFARAYTLTSAGIERAARIGEGR